MPARNCYRCGKEFRATAADRVCNGCRIPRVPRSPAKHLTVRDRQLVDLLIQGKLNKEIAHELHLTEGTVKTYMSVIFTKLDISNRTELAVWALKQQVADLKKQLAARSAETGE